MALPKIKHLERHRIFCHSTERDEVFYYCGLVEEASGSGKTNLDKGEQVCSKCKEQEDAELKDLDWYDPHRY